MRLYVPATLADLASVTNNLTEIIWTVPGRPAHAVTEALIAALPEEDAEGLEYAAFLAAAHDSLLLVADAATSGDTDVGGELLRVVVAVDVPDGAVHGVHEARDADADPSRVCVHEAIPGVEIVAVHVDEPVAAPDIQAMLNAAAIHTVAGDALLAEATARVEDRALLWYAPAELAQIPRG
ncbi:MAG: hypothetical protein FWD83_10005 [Promicromonosporaceae bacterium]|nr:hypothetical protein [Promicromonosporaceae bacterium]